MGTASATYSGLPSRTSSQIRGTSLTMPKMMSRKMAYVMTRPSRCLSAERSMCRHAEGSKCVPLTRWGMKRMR